MKALLKKSLKPLGIFAVGFFLVLLGFVYFLVGTTKGLLFAVDTANTLAKDIVKIKAPIKSGSLLDGFDCDGRLEVYLPGIITITSDNFKIAYDIKELIFDKTFHVNQIKADYLQVNLHLKDSADESEEESTTDVSDNEQFKLNFPVNINIDELNLKNFSYMSDIVDVIIDKANLVLKAHDSFASIVDGKVNKTVLYLKTDDSFKKSLYADELVEANSQEELNVDDSSLDTPLEPLIETALKSPDEMTLLKYQTVEKFPTVNLPLDVAIDNLDINEGRYYMSVYDTGKLKLNLKAHWEDTLLTVNSLKASHTLGSVEFCGTMDFTDWYYMDFKLKGQGGKNATTLSDYAGALYNLNGFGSVKGDISKLNFKLNIKGPDEVVVLGFIRPLDDDLPLAIDLTAKKFSFPFIKEKALFKEDNHNKKVTKTNNKEESSQDSLDESKIIKGIKQNPNLEALGLKLRASGSLFNGIALDFKTKAKGFGADDLDLNLKGLLNLTQANIDNLSLKGSYLKSLVDFSYKGTLEYTNLYTASGELKLNLKNASFIEDMLKGPLDLNGNFIFTYQNEDELYLNVDQLKLDFRLNGLKSLFEVEGLNASLDSLDLESLKFKQDKNTLSLKGNLSQESDFNGVFAINSLESIVPSVNGNINGRLKLLGDYKEPNVTMMVSSKKLKGPSFAINNFILNAITNVTSEEFSLTLLTDRLKVGKSGPLYKQCSFDLSGSIISHRLSLACGGGYKTFLGANGNFDKNTGVWNGRFSDLLVESSITEPITLKNPVGFSYNIKNKSGFVDAIEITDSKSNLKIYKTAISVNSIKTSLSLDGFDLDYFNVISPRDYRLKGIMNLDAKIALINGYPDIKLNLHGKNGVINVPNYHVGYEKINLDADVNLKRASLALYSKLSNKDGVLDLNLALSDPLGRKNLDGDINLDSLNLDLFSATGGIFNQLQGKADFKGSFGGSLSRPLIYGDIRLKGNAQPHYNIGTIDDFDINVKASGESGYLHGVIGVNEGKLNLNGILDWAKGANGKLTVQASSLPLFLLGYGEAFADIYTQAILSDALYIRGHVNIPKARITVSSLENAGENPSSDEVYIEYGGLDNLISEHKERTAPMNMDIRLNLDMGNDVTVNAMGLSSHIIGGIALKKDLLDKDLKAKGKISLENAKAELYGHRFLINYADTIFDGNVANPKLQVEAIADPFGIEDDVIAGVHVTGDAQDPVISLFSKPAMSQNEILSYLLYGHGLEKTTEDTSGQGSQFLMTLGLGTTTGLVNSLAGALGMQGVQFASSGSGDETTVGVQTYITKNIRLSYGYGVFTSLSEFRIRYELMRKLYAEFISSLDQSIDLIYSFDFD